VISALALPGGPFGQDEDYESIAPAVNDVIHEFHRRALGSIHDLHIDVDIRWKSQGS
jgi:hypothetical protein